VSFKRSILFLALTVSIVATGAQAAGEKSTHPITALLIVDVQQFYFPGGFSALVEPELASANAAKILERFRAEGKLVVHVGHKASKEAGFHPDVKPLIDEKIFMKTEVSCFNGTDLLDYLEEEGVDHLVICGMMTHMCVEAATRAAHDLGFEVTVISDACATKNLEFDGKSVSANDVHASTLATLSRTYATVVDTDTYLK
jgi:nicotinamidase-related amidase